MSQTSRNALAAEPRPGLTLTLSLFLLLVIVVYADPLFTHRNFAGRDLLGYHLPIEKSIHEAYGRGRLPVWISEVSGGRPLLPNPNAGALYPVRPALALLPFPVAMRIYPVLHWALAGAGMLLLVASLGVSRSGAWVGAVTYVFSGVSLTEVFFTNIQPGMTLLPWILWAFHRPVASAAGRILPLSLLFGLSFLVGDVITSSLAILCALLWLVVEREKEEQRTGLTRLGIALALAALLALPQIVATALWIPHTNRAVLGMKLGEVFLYSISPYRLLEFVVPYPFGATWAIDQSLVWGWRVFRFKSIGFFSSLYAGAFAVVALVAVRRSRLPGARFARVLFLLTLLVSVPPSLLPFAWGKVTSPLPLRYPEKLAVALALALAILAGLALDSFRRSPRTPRWTIAVGGALAFLAGSSTLAPGPAGRVAVGLTGGDPSLAKTASELLPGALAEAGLLWMATVLALELLGWSGRLPLLASLAVLTAAPIAANRRIAQTFLQEDALSPTPFVRYLMRRDPAGSYRTIGETNYRPPSSIELSRVGADPGQLRLSSRNWDQYTHALWDRGTVLNFDFDAGDLSRLESLRRLSGIAGASKNSSVFFGSLALRWGVRYRDQDPLPGYRPVGEDPLRTWDEHESPYPDIRLIERWREETGALPAAHVLQRLAPGEVVLETGSRGRGGAGPGTVRVIEKSPERLRLETASADPGWLFVLRGYWPYRTVLVDGRPTEVVPAQIAFSAIEVPAGVHRIEWTERTPGIAVSRWGPVGFLAAAMLLLLRTPPRRGSR